MAAAGAQYTVFGFDSRIDWKPTVFVDGLPKNRVCSACGLVSATIALLPCTHLLCSRCYDGSGDGERTLCPLDKDACESEDVIWTTFTKEKLLRRKVQCWNSSSGCDIVGPVCEIMDHFEKDCQYHAVYCSRCKQSMAYTKLLGHLEINDCSVLEANTASISHAVPDAMITPVVEAVVQLRDQLSSLQTGFRETKEVIASEVLVLRQRASADSLVAESLQTVHNTLKEITNQSQMSAGRTAEELALMRSSTSDIMSRLTELEALINEMNTPINTALSEHARDVSSAFQNLQEKLDIVSASSRKELENTGKKIEALQNSLAERVRDELNVKEDLKRLNERLSDELCRNASVFGKVGKVVSELPLCSSEPLKWTVEKWSELKKEAETKGETVALCEKPKLFYGYFIHPGIQINENDESPSLHLAYHVCQGGYDSLLPWPLQKKLRLHVLNGEGNQLPEYITVNTSLAPNNRKERPTNDRNGLLISSQYINLIDIQEKGFVENDNVSFQFTVSPV